MSVVRGMYVPPDRRQPMQVHTKGVHMNNELYTQLQSSSSILEDINVMYMYVLLATNTYNVDHHIIG